MESCRDRRGAASRVARLLGAAALLAGAAGAPARANVLQLNGAALGACALTTPIDGAIALGADLRSWVTTVPASVVAVNTAPATITVTRASAWASSPAGAPATTFVHAAVLSGANVGTLTGGGAASSGALSALGVTTVSVSIGASAAGPFPAGPYAAQATVTCTVP